jgi:acyl-CoA thioesterase-1
LNGLFQDHFFIRLAAVLVLAGCGTEQRPEPTPEQNPSPPPADTRPAIVAFGDSLTAGFGLDPGQSYPDILQKHLDAGGFRYRVVNAGISGDTTSGGLARVDSVAAMKPALVILELGGNDGLRGLPIETTRSNLEQIIAVLRKGDGAVVLAGMTLPPNYGPDYIGQFEQLYKDLAKKHTLPLVAFFEGIAAKPELMQKDGIHFTAEGNRFVAGNVFKVIAPLVKR